MTRTKSMFWCMLLLILIVSCKPRNVLSRKDMASVLFDLHLTEASFISFNKNAPINWTRGLENDYFQDLSYRSVLRKHQLTQEDFNASVSWYCKHLNQYGRVYQEVQDKMTAYTTDIELGRLSKANDTLASNSNSNAQLLWKFGRFKADTTALGKGCLAPNPLTTYASWFTKSLIYAPPVDTAFQMVLPAMMQDSVHQIISDTVREVAVVVNAETQQNKFYPKNSHYVDFAPGKPRLPASLDKSKGSSEMKKESEKLKSRINNLKERSNEVHSN